MVEQICMQNLYWSFKKQYLWKCSSYTIIGGALAEKFERINRDLLGKLTFWNSDAYCFDVVPEIAKQNKITKHFPTKLTPIQAPLKNEGYVCQ